MAVMVKIVRQIAGNIFSMNEYRLSALPGTRTPLDGSHPGQHISVRPTLPVVAGLRLQALRGGWQYSYGFLVFFGYGPFFGYSAYMSITKCY